MKKMALIAASAVILFLPESNRLDLLIVAAVAYFVTAYFETKLHDLYYRIQAERKWLCNLRYRNPVLVTIKPIWPVICIDRDYVLVEEVKDAE